MKQLLLSLSFLFITNIIFTQSDFSISTLENTRNKAIINLPYPIIFVHGLTGGHTTWGTLKETWTNRGFIFGGRLSYHLDYDDNIGFCDFDRDVQEFNRPIEKGDFYIVNFNTDLDGNDLGEGIFSFINRTNSNQAAIVKQGYALQQMVQKVLAITQREKVILIGHSMGGLAIREYLQNPNLWASNSSHHVAKYVSVGTPHNGSNFSGSGLGELVGLDEESDAVRDLRRSYDWTGEAGVFLFGGLENDDVIDNGFFSTYHNLDVNCDGRIATFVDGLNNEYVPNDLEYACVIGSVLGSNNSDGVVGSTSANLNYVSGFASRQIEAFQISGLFSANTSHSKLTDNILYLFRSLDEPDNYEHSYDIIFGEQYAGYMTKQGAGSYILDYDDYRFEFDGNGMIEVGIINAAHRDFTVSIISEDGETLFMEFKPDYRAVSFSPKINLPSGKYILELRASILETDEEIPYSFLLNRTNISVSTNEIFDSSLKVFPNPTDRYLQIRSEQEKLVFYRIIDVLGRNIQSGLLTDNQIDLNSLPNQKYIVQLFNEEGLFISRLIFKG